jgi:hypothetical protein
MNMKAASRCRRIFVACVTLCVAGMAPTSGGSASTWFDNAAERYERAFEEAKRLYFADAGALSAYLANPTGTPSEAVRAYIEQAGPLLAMIRRAAGEPYFDLGNPFESMPGGPLPYINGMNVLGHLLAVDAVYHMHSGDGRRAAEDLAALSQLASHLSTDGFTLSSWRAQKLGELAMGLIDQGLDRGIFESADASRLLEAVQWSGEASDPFHLANSWWLEHQRSIAWLDMARDSQEWVQRMLASTDPTFAAVAGMSDGEWLQALAEYERFASDVLAALGDVSVSGSIEWLTTIQAALAAGEYGPMATLIAGDMYSVIDLVETVHGLPKAASKMTVGIEERLSRATRTPDGAQAEAERNAAVWYARAAEKIREIRGSEREPTRERQSSINPPSFSHDRARHPQEHESDGARVEKAVRDEAVELMRRGAACRRCDFGVMPAHLESAPKYIGDLRACLDAMREVASERAASGVGGEALEILADALRVIHHLTTSGSLAASVTAQVEFCMSSEAIEGVVESFESPADEMRPESLPRRLVDVTPLLDAARRFAMPDPFGYAFAREVAAERVVSAWLRVLPDGSRERLLRPTQEFVAARSADDLFGLHFILESTGTDAPAMEVSWLPVDPAELDHLYDIRGPVAEALRAAMHGALADWQFPDVLRVADRRADGRTIVLTLLKRLSPPASESGESATVEQEPTER